MSIFEKFEKAVDDALKKVGRRGQQREPLEIRRAIITEIEGKITPLGDGKRVFPFNQVGVQLFAPDAETRALYEVAFIGERMLASTIGERLRPPKCETPANLKVSVTVVEDAGVEWAADGFHIVYGGGGAAAAAPAEEGRARAKAQLIVVHGEAKPLKYRITKRRTNIGRQAEVLDKEGLPLRRNDLAFKEDDSEINRSVSRSHAHIKYNQETGEYRLHDENSAYGTLIIRADGRRVKVSRGLGAPLNPAMKFTSARPACSSSTTVKDCDHDTHTNS